MMLNRPWPLRRHDALYDDILTLPAPPPRAPPVLATRAGMPRMAVLGRLGTPQLACLRSWRRQGLACVFLHADPAPLPRLVQALLGVRCVHLGAMKLQDPAWVAGFAQVLEDEAIDALTCVSEPISQALWACRSALPDRVQIASVRPPAAQFLESKCRQDALARECGLDTLPSWRLAPGSQAAVPAEAFPLVLRPDVARLAQPPFKVAVVHNQAQLQAQVDGLLPGSSALIAQPLVHGPNLLVHGWRSADGRVSGHQAFRVDVKYQGLTVVMRPVPLDAPLAQGLRRMEEALGLAGVFHCEFIEDSSGRAHYLDLNPRLGGTTGKALAAGFDEPLALLATLLPAGLPHGAFISARLRTSGGKHQALSALWSLLRGRSSQTDYPYPDRRRLRRELLTFLLRGRDELLRADALRSLLGFVVYQVVRRLARA